jgi:hypothetical protein
VLTLAAEIVVGIGVFAGLMLVFDGIGSRRLLVRRLFPRTAEAR